MTDITALRAIWTVSPQPQPWPDFAHGSSEPRLGKPQTITRAPRPAKSVPPKADDRRTSSPPT